MHKNWIKWYATITLYAEYIKKSAKISNPFQMIPQSIYNVDEVHTPSIYGLHQSTLENYAELEEKDPQYKDQVKNGLPLGKGNYLRTFPVWYWHRGSAGIQMAQAKGLAVASHLRNDLQGIDLAQNQLEWIVGRNPFAQSTIYGEGYNFPLYYFVSSGPIVGSIACGILTNGNSDIPNFPASACYTYKEIWSHPANRWLMLVNEVNGIAKISGIANKSEKQIEFIETNSNTNTIVEVDEQGSFNSELTAGNYKINYGDNRKEITLTPGKDYKIDLTNRVKFSVKKNVSTNGEIEIEVLATGNGKTKFELRGFNFNVIGDIIMEVNLKNNAEIKFSWKGIIRSTNKPFVAVVIANNDITNMKEVSYIGL